MVFGHKKKVSASTAPNSFGKTTQATFGTDFGTGTSNWDKKTGNLSTTTSLAPGLQPSSTAAQTGLASALQYLQRAPDEQVNYLRSGQDPLYNILSMQNQRAENQAMADAALKARRYGGINSTSYGGMQGMLASNDLLRQNQNLLSALDYGNNTARQNAGVDSGVITNLANLTYPLGAQANNDLMTAIGSRNQNAEFNAQQKQNASMANAQIANSSSPFGNILNAVGTIGGGLIGGSLGGPAGAMIGSSLGGSLRRIFGGGSSPSSGYDAQPNISPFSYLYGSQNPGGLFGGAGSSGMMGGFV